MTLSMFGGGLDPFGSVLNDPFFGFGDVGMPLGGFPFSDIGTTGRRRGRARRAAPAAEADVDVGHWHFDYYLTEPVQLEMEEHNDKYLMRLYHPGVSTNKIKLDIDNDTLIVSGDYDEGGQEQTTTTGQEQKGAASMETEAQTKPTTTQQGQQQGAGTQQGQQGTTQQQARQQLGTRILPRRQYKRFIRYMVLPPDVEQQSIEAKHQDEYLLVTLKKVQGTAPRTQRIQIK